LVVLLAAGGLLAQDSGMVLRFDVDLVQIDAVVTGRDGRRVTGLGPEDFEVLQDGKPQKLTHFSYITGKEPLTQGPQRTIVVLVDDIYLEFADYVVVRRALMRFIDEEVRAGDMVSLVYTSRGSGALRQFTSDRRLLHRAVESMHWRPPTAVELTSPELSLIREMGHVLAELGGFPGRKSVVLVAPGTFTQIADVRVMADIANRTSVTFHSIDARGLPAAPPAMPGIDTSTSLPTARPPRAWSPYFRSQDTLSLLASATGGLFAHDSNGTFEQLRDAAEDTSGYYLIGWYPGADAFKKQREVGYHRIQIRARNKGLRVRTREGYFARTGTAGPRQIFSAHEQMRQALVSPFHTGDLEVNLSASFDRQEAAGSYVDSLLHIAAKGVSFEQDMGGCWNARLELVRALWPVDLGIPPNDRVNTQILDVHTCGKTAERVMSEGLVAAVEDRVPSPGAYQVRVAVRNASADDDFSFGPQTLVRREGTQPVKTLLGSATQFLLIPDLRRKGLALSGLILWSGEAPPTPVADVAYRTAKPGDPAVRQFRTGEEMRYAFRVFGGEVGRLDVRLRVLRDGREVAAAPAPLSAEGEASGVFPLTGLMPGDYVLGVEASTAPAKGKAQRAEQWLDFAVR
jgi:VWFA-related protein